MTPTPPLHFPPTSRLVLANARMPAGMVQGLPPDARLDEEGSARLDLLSTLAQSKLCFSVFDQKRSEWSGRVDLQAVAISGINVYLSQQGKELADLAAKYGGLLGGATDTLSRGADGTHKELDRALDRMFELAGERGLDVDLHVDQTEDLSAFTIPNIARSKLKTGFKGRVVCGHCVNLSLQPPELIDSTLALAREADLAFVSMPTPMMYLMDRKKDRTPRWRGVTAAKEILAAGLPLAVGGDNCRDAWFPYGDRPIRPRQGRYGTARQYGSFFRPPLGGLFMCAQDGRTPAGASAAVG